MSERSIFRARLQKALDDIGPRYLDFDREEFWMYQRAYEYLEYFSVENQMFNLAIALHLSRGLHNGTHRKSSIVRDGKSYRLPYVIHCLTVARILLDVNAALSHDELDILLASSLCHDMIEDLPFEEHGQELYKKFHLDPLVYETVRLVSKRKDFTEEEEKAFFHNIESNKLALLIKLSDRSHNVEDLYNMSVWKVHEYIGETEKFFLPMCEYGMEHYPELIHAIQILKDKILCLTSASGILVDRYEKRQQELKDQLHKLQEENAALRARFSALWDD